MLVLTRRVGEKVVVPECGLAMTVLEVHGNKIRLGFSAPPHVHIFRRELWDNIQHGPASNGEGSPPAQDAQGNGTAATNGASRPV